MLCIGVRRDVTGYHTLARNLMKWRTVSISRTKQCKYKCMFGFSKQNCVTCLWTAENQHLQLAVSRLQKVTALALCYQEILYTHTSPLSIFFSKWIKAVIGVALKRCFSQVNFLSNKVEFANPFIILNALAFFSLSSWAHLQARGNVKFFNQSWIH